MSFTDGKQRNATEDDCFKVRWSGSPPGLRFRCKLCGYRFTPGDLRRWIMANGRGSPVRTGNFFVCCACDDSYKHSNELLLKRMAELEEEAFTRFWWLVEDDRQLAMWDK